MKLDRLKFAKLIAHCCSNGLSTGDWEIERIDELCEYEAPAQPVGTAKCSDVDSLMMLMAEGTSKVEAIRNYLVLTGAGFKESKDAVERYWKPAHTRVGSMLKKIDEQINKTGIPGSEYILSDTSSLDCVKAFIESFHY